MNQPGRPKVGLFAGAIQQYWTECGMDGLPEALERDVRRLRDRLERDCDVVYPFLAVDVDSAARAGGIFLAEGVDMVLIYHASYVDDAMTVALLREIRGITPVLFFSQGLDGIPSDLGPVEAATCWGVNSAVQMPGSLKRLWPESRHGFVFGHLESPAALSEIVQYARAARCVKRLAGKRVGVLPHRSAGVPMYDTYPDEARLIGQTGIEITYLYIHELVERMHAVRESEAEALTDELYATCEVVEPPRSEILLAARQAIALERLVAEKGLDALAIDVVPGLTPACGMLPCVGMARLIDAGLVVASEGDLAVSVAGLIIGELCALPIHFWEHSMFDEERNWILGGHEGGSAGFRMAKKGTRPLLRSTQYINFGRTPGAPYYGVLPEFITDPGPVTLLTLFCGQKGYEMRIARGVSVDTPPRPVHYEHTIFQPNIPLQRYFERIDAVGTCHHFGLVHADLGGEVEKVARILDMELVYLTD